MQMKYLLYNRAMKKLEHKSFAVLITLFCMFLWGSAFPLLKLTYGAFQVAAEDNFSKIFLAGLRFFVAGGLVFVLRFLLGEKSRKKNGRDYLFVTLLGLISVTVQYIFFYIGVGNTAAVKSSIIMASSTFLTLLLSTLVFRLEKLRAVHLFSFMIGFSGIILANFSKDLNLQFHLNGEGLLLLSAFTVSLGSVLVSRQGASGDSFFYAGAQMLIGAIPLLIIGYLGMPKPLHLTWTGGVYILYGALLSSLAFTLWYQVLRYHPAGEMSFYRLFVPIFASLLSVLILKESFGRMQLIALALVSAGMFILERFSRKKTQEQRG